MAAAWQSQDAPVRTDPIGPLGWALVVLRGAILGGWSNAPFAA